ncbi:hypothetical protein KA977_10930 [Candidatus Dependentiae bacterium]|nr:hypothetical protein [Candidatus Dependentiae bacterium]
MKVKINKILLIFIVLLLGCASNKKSIYKQTDSNLLWSSEKKRPDWVLNEYPADKEYLYFVGISDKCISEKDGRDAALKHSIKQFSNYIGTSVKNKYSEIITRYNLSSEISNPNVTSIEITDMVSESIARKLKPLKWYIEKYQDKSGLIYFMTYSLAAIPKSEADRELDRLDEITYSEIYKNVFELNIKSLNTDGTQENSAQNKIGQILSERGIKISFNSSAADFSSTDIDSIMNGNLSALNKIQFKVKAKYIITGSAQTEFSGHYINEESGLVVCRASGLIKIIDIYSGTELLRLVVDDKELKGIAKDKLRAGKIALDLFGQKTGERIAEFLETRR